MEEMVDRSSTPEVEYSLFSNWRTSAAVILRISLHGVHWEKMLKGFERPCDNDAVRNKTESSTDRRRDGTGLVQRGIRGIRVGGARAPSATDRRAIPQIVMTLGEEKGKAAS